MPKFARGHKLPPRHVSAARHRASNAKHGDMLRALPQATQVAYDAYDAPGGSCVPPIGDQGQCGDCHEWSASKVCAAAQMTAGVVKPGSGFMLSVQWMLDYHHELGGCNGGDEYADAQAIQSGGAPSLAEYPGAGQSPGRPLPVTGMTLYNITNLVYVDPTQTDQGVASTQSIKNAILAYSYVSVAVAAGSDWDNYQAGQTLTGRSQDINHAVGLTGWDDNHDNGDGTKGAWLLDNQWGDWGDKGRCWIKYGAEQVGTQAFIALAAAPPAPPAPTPPTPIPPPTPPGPAPESWEQWVIAFLEGLLGKLKAKKGCC